MASLSPPGSGWVWLQGNDASTHPLLPPPLPSSTPPRTCGRHGDNQYQVH